MCARRLIPLQTPCLIHAGYDRTVYTRQTDIYAAGFGSLEEGREASYTRAGKVQVTVKHTHTHTLS